MSALVRYEQARQALAACRSVDEIKDIRDKSEAMRLYAKQAHDTELEQWAAEIKLRAQRAIGELSAALETQKGGFGIVPTGGKHKAEVLAEAGISTSTANRYEKLAAIPEPIIEEVIAKSREAGKPVSAKVVMAQVAPKPAPRAQAAPADAQPLDAGPDELYDQAVTVVLTNRRTSISLVQRHLCIGYNRAARLLEQMERAGVVSPTQSNGNRDILVPGGPAATTSPSLVRQAPEQQAVPAATEQDAEGRAEEADPFDQLMADFQALTLERDELRAKVAQLEEHIQLLTGDDLAAQVSDLTYKCAQFDSLATSRFNEIANLQQVIAGQRSFIESLRRAAGLPKGGDLVAWIKDVARRAA